MSPTPHLWRKSESLYTLHAELLETRGNICTVRFVATGAQCVMQLDPATQGPRGYERIAAPSCDCTGNPHLWEFGCPAPEVTT
jgi:hypothetical protein